MYSKATGSLLLSILGITYQFAYGFSLKPHNNHNTLHKIAVSRSFPKTFNSDYAPSIVLEQRNSLILRGGSSKSSAVSESSDNVDVSSNTFANKLASFWAASGVIMILGKSIKRILPIAMEPFNGVATPLSTLQLV